MIRFFNSTFITRPVLLLLIFVAINLPLVLLGVPVTLPELKAMVLGERLNEGVAMYRDVFDTTGPLAAFIFWIIDLLNGRSLFLYRFLAGFLLLFQAFNLNATFNRYQVHPQKTYLPALFYILGGSFFFEFDTLSPLLIGQTFLVYSVRYFIIVSKEGSNNPKLFKAGFFIGLAALSYLPLTFFLVVGYFAVVFFASNTFRSFLLLLCGFFFPFAALATYYLYNGALTNFQAFYLSAEGLFGFNLLLPFADLAKLLTIPLLLLVWGILNAANTSQGLVFQQKMQQLMRVWFLAAFLMLLSSPDISALGFLLFLPPLGYYSYFIFPQQARWWITETAFLLLLALLVSVRYSTHFGLDRYLNIDSSALQLKNDEKYRKIVNAPLLVLGPDLQYYAYNYAASPYLNWNLAQQDFGNLDSYQAIFNLHRNLAANPPAYIMDEQNLMPHLVYKLPTVFGRYRAAGAKNLYQLQR